VAIKLGLAAFLLMLVYPLTKRFIYFPQLFLGLTFNGVLIAYAAVQNKISMSAIIMYLACCCWTCGYDTIYGFMDFKDDKKINLKSTSLFLENRNYKFWLSLFYSLFIILFTLANYIEGKRINPWFIFGTLCSSSSLWWQIKTLNINDPQNCLMRFKNNVFVGLCLAIIML
jgi:4-hydroxybenzoate polyprenyltransferase